MRENHEAIHELLAGYVLRSLSGPDAEEADRLLTDHVPGCSSCRETLVAFGAVAADLGLDAPALATPDTLLPRIHRELEPPRARFGSGRFTGWNTGRIVAVAASVMLVIGLGAVALSRGGGSSAEGVTFSAADLQQIRALADDPGTKTSEVGPITEVAPADVEEFYVIGENIPQPPIGTVYRLWAVTTDGPEYLFEFLPSSTGLVALKVSMDATPIQELIVTVEPIDSEPSEPGAPAWESAA